MKNILACLIWAILATSCSEDPMGLRSPLNQKLDSAIENRVSSLRSNTLYTKSITAHLDLDVSKIDKDIKAFWTSINLFNACTETCEMADQYFNEWSLKLKMDNEAFIKLTELNDKPEIIIAIKKNELKLLEQIFLVYNKGNKLG